MGASYYDEVQKKLIDWYSVINHLCTIGDVEKMYIPPAMDLSKSIIENQNLFEERLCKDLGIANKSKTLDIGCGRGRIAMHISQLSGSNVTGINIDTDQMESARLYANKLKLNAKCEFHVWDMNDIPFAFPDSTFDAVYHVQVFSLSKDLEKLLQEIYRILKPGGKFGCLDWISLPQYDPSNEEHQELMKAVKSLVGAIGTPTEQEYVTMLRNAGFTVTTSTNLSIDGLQAPLIEKVDQYFNSVFSFIRGAVKCKVLPKHFFDLLERLTKGGKAFVTADRLRILTTSHYIIAEKPIH